MNEPKISLIQVIYLMDDEGISHIQKIIQERTDVELDDHDAAYIAGNIVEFLTRPESDEREENNGTPI